MITRDALGRFMRKMAVPSANYIVTNTKREYSWIVRIDVRVNSFVQTIVVKSRKWSITGKWMPAVVWSDIKFHYLRKEEMLKALEALTIAGKYAVDMDMEHAPLGPTFVE